MTSANGGDNREQKCSLSLPFTTPQYLLPPIPSDVLHYLFLFSILPSRPFILLFFYHSFKWNTRQTGKIDKQGHNLENIGAPEVHFVYKKKNKRVRQKLQQVNIKRIRIEVKLTNKINNIKIISRKNMSGTVCLHSSQ